ncbi:hypothetical protein GGR34_000731 [Microvirga flocculans]|uniref:Uncharacterized protein n=1 Tax=Microvirga flocculans TaxID=217168 RepID=A0A7W6ICT4_9HYPH|nr:hypothetical protein [Microvirga flocculans]MBB4039096.1 hypothetical protein [Microvirga flocculans]
MDPYDLPSAAFVFANNCRFEDGKIQRGAVFRKICDLTEADPIHVVGYTNSVEAPVVYYVTEDGRIYERTFAGDEEERTASGYTPSYAPLPVTSASLNGVLYINKGDRVPWYVSKNASSGTSLQPIPVDDSGYTQWRTEWRARVLRSMNGMLVAFNVTKGANANPNMVKWSDFGIDPYAVVPNWDFTSPESSAGENTLAEMKGGIIDAYPLRNRMYIFSDVETWLMESVGGVEIFRFDRAFDRGVINTNCVMEVAGLQYVFGSNDIWFHDGTTADSLASGRVRRFIYDSLRRDESKYFFVTYNQRLNEVIFCYVSDDQYVKFPAVSGKGCNRAAIYNTESKVWYFADLPYVTCAAHLPITFGQQLTFENVTGTFATVGGAFSQLELTIRTNLTFGSKAQGDVSHALRTFEAFREVETGYLLDEVVNSPAYLERTGIDLDEIGSELRGYKCVSSIYPQGRLDYEAAPLVFTFGIADHAAQDPEWGTAQTYDRVQYKLDYNLAGRYLALKIEQTDFLPFTLSALDLDVIILGQF